MQIKIYDNLNQEYKLLIGQNYNKIFVYITSAKVNEYSSLLKTSFPLKREGWIEIKDIINDHPHWYSEIKYLCLPKEIIYSIKNIAFKYEKLKAYI